MARQSEQQVQRRSRGGRRNRSSRARCESQPVRRVRPFSGRRYWENCGLPCASGSEPCALCGRPIQPDRQTHWVRVVDGGGTFGRRHDSDDGPGEMGCWPVGSECLPKLRAAGLDGASRSARGCSVSRSGLFDSREYPCICSAIERDESGCLEEELERWVRSLIRSSTVLRDPESAVESQEQELEQLLSSLRTKRLIPVRIPVIVYGGKGLNSGIRLYVRPYWVDAEGNEHTYRGAPRALHEQGLSWRMYHLTHVLTVPQEEENADVDGA